MIKIILIALGGSLGALIRFFLVNASNIFFTSGFYGTLIVNIIGSFFIGYLISLGYHKFFSENFFKYFLIIGFLGSFTTFSAFSYEALDLLLSKKTFFSFLYILFSVVSCITAVYIGFNINKL